MGYWGKLHQHRFRCTHVALELFQTPSAALATTRFQHSLGGDGTGHLSIIGGFSLPCLQTQSNATHPQPSCMGGRVAQELGNSEISVNRV